MKKIEQGMLNVAIAALLASPVSGFDAEPPPKVKTIEWTLEVMENPKRFGKEPNGFKVRTLMEHLSSSMGFPGYYIKIDASSVKDRLDEKILITEEEMTSMRLLVLLADRMNADILISPGTLKLVPRTEKK